MGVIVAIAIIYCGIGSAVASIEAGKVGQEFDWKNIFRWPKILLKKI